MAIVVGDTRETIRVSIGYFFGVDVLTAATAGTTDTVLVDDIFASADTRNGYWTVFTSGTNDSAIRRVVDTTVTSNRTTMTVFPALSAATTSGDTLEVWPPHIPPLAVHNAINQSIRDATGHIFDPDEDITLHTGGRSRFSIPSDLEVLTDVQIRESYTGKTLIMGGTTWDESVDPDFTVTQDSEDKLFGKVATKFEVAATVSDGDLVADSISSMDLSNLTHIEFPIKVRTAVAASDLVLRLSATANGADTDKIIAIPALSAQSETWVRVAMSESVSSFDPSECTAIISVALEYNANSGANTIWIGTIEATDNDSYKYESMPRDLWDVDKEARELVFTRSGQSWAGYSLLKLIGGDNPALLTSDAAVTEVPERYIVYHALGTLMLRPKPGEGPEDRRARLAEAANFRAMAEQEKRAFSPLVNARFTQ